MSKKKYDQFNCSRIILPEHRESLKAWRETRCREESSSLYGELDEQQKEEFDYLLHQSVQEGFPVNIIIRKKEGNLVSLNGIPQVKCPQSGKLKLITKNGTEVLFVEEIIKIERP